MSESDGGSTTSGICKVFTGVKTLSSSEEESLVRQDSRGLVAEFQQRKLEEEAAKNWDKFYKRNETR